MKLGVVSNNYPQERLILDANIKDVQYVTYPNLFNCLYNRFNTYEFFVPTFQKVDAYHTINTCMITRKPWCCTFETMIPRGCDLLHVQHNDVFNVKPRKGLRKLLELYAKDNCVQLMALSECNYRLQQRVYEIYPDIQRCLQEKTCAIKVPQPLLAPSYKQSVNDKIHFFFLGKDFTRKGAVEIILAANKLRKQRNDFEFIIVTNTQNTHNYVFKDFQDSREENNKIFNIINESEDWLHIYPPLPFSKVKELMLKCDVGLLPTWGETYGYSTLEMQAAGLPVISTNIRALTETNPYGWIVELPTNYAGELALKDRRQKEFIRETLVKGLYNIFWDICENRTLILKRSRLSFDFINTVHSPKKYVFFLQKVYRNLGL